jgi:hypothetical protein
MEVKMNEKVEQLSGTMAVEILRTVARKWLENRGVEAFVVIDNIRRKYGSEYDSLPAWLSVRPNDASTELVVLSKLALSAILDGDDSASKEWVEEELKDLKQAHAHAVDPITLVILGATIIGIILASRVKKIGDIEFYEGVPKETVDIVKHATTIPFP